MTSLQAGSPGTQACINAGNAVSDIISDLDNTIMLAITGTLQAECENKTFLDYKEYILKVVKYFMEDTKCFVAGAASRQEQLAAAAQTIVPTFAELAELIKDAAASLGSNNRETQVLLITAVKDVATALGDLVPSTKAAFSKGIDDPEMSNLRESARVLVTKVTLLLKNMRSVADEQSKGTLDSESTMEATGQEHKQAGSAVIRATDNLVGAAQQAIEHNDERSILVNKRIECGMVQELMAREEIIRKERELEVAREKLAALRKAKYGNRSPDEYQGNGLP